MKELTTRGISGILYISLFVASLYLQTILVFVLAIFGLISLIEFSNLIKLKSYIQYLIFILLYLGVWYIYVFKTPSISSDKIIQLLVIVTVSVNLLLIKDLFKEKKKSYFKSKRYIITTLYLSGGFIFMLLIANHQNTYTPSLLLGSFILVWVNDSFAYIVGKNFGKQKLFSSISPKKTVEGFLGGLFFACISSYFITLYTKVLDFKNWLILALIISIIGTIGDLIESKFKRLANVKDSGVIMPGHGGLLDRLDSIIFAAPFIYLFLRIISYVS